MMTIEPRLLAPWMAAQHKEVFDIALPLHLLEHIQDAINGGVIDDPQNTYKHGRLLPVVALNGKLYQYLESLGIESEGLQHFVIQNALGRVEPKSLPMQFLNALVAGSGDDYQQWKDHIVSNGWHRDKPFYRELLNILIEEIALIPVGKRVSSGKAIEEFYNSKRIERAGILIKALKLVHLNEEYKPPLTGMYASELRKTLIGIYGSIDNIPTADRLRIDIDEAMARTGRYVKDDIPARDSIRGMLDHISNPDGIPTESRHTTANK
ncbi:MAG: hypothetical protein BWK73_35890 [Thiothrix lacustris]|uniref:Uncharacterized protein n=1 Tax=Thiothrix lacustris TaxID=525917 RepID=A0A1Y1QFS9_9GAMM|nr:MAG: hypothetical protein BWK73_35890 [Thiothrix lacustris]